MSKTIDALLAARAIDSSDRCFLRFRSGEMTFGCVNERATGLAHGFRNLGVRPTDMVGVLMPNCPEFLLVWFGLMKLGAVLAPINTALRGDGLSYVLSVTQAEVLVVDDQFADEIEGIVADLDRLHTLVVNGDTKVMAKRFPALRVLNLSDLESDDRTPLLPVNREADLALLLFTSGTTGRSKGCELSHRYAVRHAEMFADNLRLRPDDVLYCPFPLFHLDAAILTVMPALVLGATAAVGERFSVNGFWDEVRNFGATVFDFMGATITMLYKQPPNDGDADNLVRLAWGVPLPGFAAQFEMRFDLRLTEVYGLTDAGVVMYEPLDEPQRRVGACGRPTEAFDVRLVDVDDLEVPLGEIGEIAIRPLEASIISERYHRMPTETLAVRGNLWLHTGDRARRDADGFFYFAGRQVEVIRRRGENISAFEIERLMNTHPDILEAAAFGVPSELGEDDVMVSLIPQPGKKIDPKEIVNFCRGRMADFMTPRYIDIVSSLPRTPTEKTEKYRLMETGVTGRTWDREDAGKR